MVSVDGGKTWSTWYNQPTAQIYHVAADNRFPYWLYGAQQDSGGVGVSTWSREGVLSFRNWEPTCEAGESNTVVPDPKDGNILYGSGAGRCDQALQYGRAARRTAAAARSRTIPTARRGRCRRSSRRPTKRCTTPISSSSARATAAAPGQKISPDLARLHPAVPETLDPVTAKDIDEAMTDRFGVVYTIGPSPLSANTVWVGTDDGLIHVTRDDGKTWNNVTPPDMTVVEQGFADRSRPLRRRRPRTPRWTAIASPTTSRTSIARTMAARPGRTWSPAFPRAPTSTR